MKLSLLFCFEGFTSSTGLVLRTMTLVAPSSAICRCASTLAPSAIASMAMTDETPKINPKIVSSTRSLCSVRLRRARAMAMERRYISRAFRARCARGIGLGIALVLDFLGFLGLELGGGPRAGVEGYVVALLQAIDHLDQFFVVVAHFHLPAMETSGLLDERIELSFVLGDGLHRNNEHVVKLA